MMLQASGAREKLSLGWMDIFQGFLNEEKLIFMYKTLPFYWIYSHLFTHVYKHPATMHASMRGNNLSVDSDLSYNVSEL